MPRRRRAEAALGIYRKKKRQRKADPQKAGPQKAEPEQEQFASMDKERLLAEAQRAWLDTFHPHWRERQSPITAPAHRLRWIAQYLQDLRARNAADRAYGVCTTPPQLDYCAVETEVEVLLESEDEESKAATSPTHSVHDADGSDSDDEDEWLSEAELCVECMHVPSPQRLQYWLLHHSILHVA